MERRRSRERATDGIFRQASLSCLRSELANERPFDLHAAKRFRYRQPPRRCSSEPRYSGSRIAVAPEDSMKASKARCMVWGCALLSITLADCASGDDALPQSEETQAAAVT